MSTMSGVGTSLVRLACNQTHHVEGEGDVISSYNGSMKHIIVVLYTRRVTKNLLLEGNITNKGCVIAFDPIDCWIVNAKNPTRIEIAPMNFAS